MTIGSDRGAVQKPFLRYAEEVGWTYLSPEDALAKRRGLISPVPTFNNPTVLMLVDRNDLLACAECPTQPSTSPCLAG